jgi:hypothetical protein
MMRCQSSKTFMRSLIVEYSFIRLSCRTNQCLLVREARENVVELRRTEVDRHQVVLAHEGAPLAQHSTQLLGDGIIVELARDGDVGLGEDALNLLRLCVSTHAHHMRANERHGSVRLPHEHDKSTS